MQWFLGLLRALQRFNNFAGRGAFLLCFKNRQLCLGFHRCLWSSSNLRSQRYQNSQYWAYFKHVEIFSKLSLPSTNFRKFSHWSRVSTVENVFRFVKFNLKNWNELLIICVLDGIASEKFVIKTEELNRNRWEFISGYVKALKLSRLPTEGLIATQLLCRSCGHKVNFHYFIINI